MSGPCSWNNSRDLIHQTLSLRHSRICHTKPKGQALCGPGSRFPLREWCVDRIDQLGR